MGRIGRTRWVGKVAGAVVVCFAAATTLAGPNPTTLSDLSDLPNPSRSGLSDPSTLSDLSGGARTQPAARPAAQPKPRGRLFAPQDLGLIDAPDRDQWQKADQIMDALGIAEGSAVADLGAAGGWFTLRLARRVGPNGMVYAEDIQPLMLRLIGRLMQRENLTHVKTILGTPTDPRLPPGLDAALIADAYHEMDDPADPRLIVTLLQNIAKSLKPQGRLGIVDWVPGSGGPGPAADQRVNPEVVIRAANAAGLRLVAREELPPFVLLLVFARTNADSSR
jgi:SAM-dependent methyltransferase